MDSYFEARRKQDGKACKGEEICGKIGRPDGEKGIKGKLDSFEEIEMICRDCPFIGTKPGNMPMRLSPLVSIAYRMEALLGENPGSAYPHFFTPLEWECFLTLKYARAKDSERDLAKPKQNTRADAQRKLEERMRRD